MSWSDTYALRFTAFDVSRTAATYGGGLYGEGTYGTEVTDPLPNKDYVVMPRGGSWPSDIGWTFHTDDILGRFEAVLVGVDGVMDLSPLTSATLVLERVSAGPRTVLAYPLTISTVDNHLYRPWGQTAGDIVTPGTFRVQIIVGFASGRGMTIEPSDGATLIVRPGAVDAVV